MKRILILGSAGSGKSTLAKILQDRLHLPVIHLDQYFWKPGWIKPEDSEWEGVVSELVGNGEWIMDGNYRKTLVVRLATADTVILLDFPRLVCLWRIFKRRLKNNRQDCIKGCRERIDPGFLFWILYKFPHVSKKQILKKLIEVKDAKNIFILKSDKEVDHFLFNLSK